MMPAHKAVIIYTSAIMLSYAIAYFSGGLYPSSAAPMALSQVRPVGGTIYSLSGDARREDPAHIVRDSTRTGRNSVVFAGCPPAAPGDLVQARLMRICSVLREIDPGLYRFTFASDVHRPQGTLPEQSQP